MKKRVVKKVYKFVIDVEAKEMLFCSRDISMRFIEQENQSVAREIYLSVKYSSESVKNVTLDM